ncbi:MAG TPA: DUF3089 domain-containing protein [Caulobacteraceae bacterium]
MGAVVLLVITGLFVWRDDILQALLDPKIPYAVYRPPPTPDYRSPVAWARLPGVAAPGDPPVDVFFIHSTTFDGGKDWNGPIGNRVADRRLARSVLPNYAGPFAATGRVFVPRYRQASLYTSLTLFDDALQARQFAYGDVRAAFLSFLSRIGSRPFIIAGVEQGGELGARLIADVVTPNSGLRGRMVAAYLVDAVTPAEDHAGWRRLPACQSRQQAGCVVAWISARRFDFVQAQKIMSRSVVWSPDGRLVGLAGREPLCVNPLLGAQSDAEAPARLNLGAANATGLEWGARPGFMARQVSARCEAGILRVSRPRSALLRPSGDWADRRRAPSYNLFWADIEADAQARMNAWLAVHGETISQPS